MLMDLFFPLGCWKPTSWPDFKANESLQKSLFFPYWNSCVLKNGLWARIYKVTPLDIWKGPARNHCRSKLIYKVIAIWSFYHMSNCPSCPYTTHTHTHTLASSAPFPSFASLWFAGAEEFSCRRFGALYICSLGNPQFQAPAVSQ